jgi:hypothetical protein
VGHLYAQVKERTGMVIAPLERYLTAVPEQPQEPTHPPSDDGNNGSPA